MIQGLETTFVVLLLKNPLGVPSYTTRHLKVSIKPVCRRIVKRFFFPSFAPPSPLSASGAAFDVKPMRGTRSSVCVNDNSGSYNLIQQRGVHSASSKRSVSPFKNLWLSVTFCHSNRNVQRKLCSKPPTAEHYKCLPTPKKSCMLFTGTFGQISAVNFLSGAGYKRVCASNRLGMAQARQSRRMCGRRYFYQR